MPKKSGIDTAWEILFERHHILERIAEEGRFVITSAEINTVKEARLMAKFDRSAQLPQIFKRHRLSILPTARGEYVIGPFCTHCPVSYHDARPKTLPVPALQTLDPGNLYSEAAALLYCFNSGLFADLLGSDQVRFTVNGRMSSGQFGFRVADTGGGAAHHIQVTNAQVEIDAGYETPDCFCICEAKNMASEELLVRQLYYPYRLWRARIAKPVIPVFLAVSNDLFHVFRYRFDEEAYYNSLALVSHTAYSFGTHGVSLADLEHLWRTVQPGPEPREHPFPQANSFARVVDLLAVLYERPLSRDEVTLKYEFDSRQTDYYIAACEYLELAERWQEGGTHGVRLTEGGREILSRGVREKYLGLMERVLRRPVFHRALGAALRSGEVPNKNLVARMMMESRVAIGANTMDRRASTVRGWIGWMLGQCGQGEQMTIEQQISKTK